MSEQDIADLKKIILDLQSSMGSLRSDMRDLTIHVEYLKAANEESKKKWWNIALAAIAAFVGVVVVFITGGGLDGK